MADLQLEVPQHVEHGFDHALAPGGLLVGQQEQEIDVGAGRQRAAAVAARRHDREALARRGVLRRVKLARDRLVDDPHHAVHEGRQTLGAGETVAFRDQLPVGVRAAAIEHRAQLGNEPGAHGRGIARGDLGPRRQRSQSGITSHGRLQLKAHAERPIHI